MSLFKKLLLTLFCIVIFASLGGTLFLNQIGINPMLWFSEPNTSQLRLGTNDIAIRIDPIQQEFKQITDFQFYPKSDSSLLVLQKTGELFQIDLDPNTGQTSKQLLFKLNVLTDSEQGLLGIAIHPNYPQVPCLYLNAVINKSGRDTSQISEWCVDWEGNNQRWYQNKILFELEQPYKNHNAGHLIFDQAGLLYIPWGDGGSGGDPQGNAQNLQSYLGKILRINPEPFNTEIPYSIPQDNPFVNSPDVPDEIYAYGLRNPWKLAFDTQNRLIAADVGQDAWEEITFIEAGGNHGWNTIEAMHCFKESCTLNQQNENFSLSSNMVMPFIEYGHDVGRSITGGYVYLSDNIPELNNKYIYGDFVSGRLWAADLPDSNTQKHPINSSDTALSQTKIYELGQWPLLISSFARDHSGNIYIAGFARGKIYKMLPATGDSNNKNK